MTALEFIVWLFIAGGFLWIILYCGEEIMREMREREGRMDDLEDIIDRMADEIETLREKDDE